MTGVKHAVISSPNAQSAWEQPATSPKMIIDVHTHLFPPDIRHRRERYFDQEPAFKLLYRSSKAKMIGARELVAAMDAEGVNISVVFGFPWQDPVICQKHNDYIMAAIARYPERLVGFCCVDPCWRQAAQEVERGLAGGLSGVGELAFYQGGPDQQALDHLAPIMALCQQKDLPVLIHTNEPVGHLYPGKSPNTLKQIYDLLKRFAPNRIVLAHWGGGLFFYRLLKKEMGDLFANVYVDTAASPFLYDPSIYRHAVQILGADNILFGSDYPLLPPSRYFGEMAQAGLTYLEKNKLKGANASRLLKLNAP